MLKKKITNIILNNRTIGKASISILNIKNYIGSNYDKECERRKKLDLCEYKKLSEDMKPYYDDLSPNSSYYGIMHHIKRFADIENYCYYNIEHGLYLGEYIDNESFGKGIKGTITFSKKRKEYLEKKVEKKVVTIGPYIHYADNYYTDEKHNYVKNKLGRVLLAFPPHSTKSFQASYDTNFFINKLKIIGKEYDTIMVCMFFKDIQLGAHVPYEEAGFKIVTSGNMYDYYFLSRQKEIISLSDYTVSASVGTHIGYCLYLGKQHQILSLSDDGGLDGNLYNNIDKRSGRDEPQNVRFETFKTDQELLLNAFIDTGGCGEKEKHDLVADIWGFNCIKNRYELKNLLQ